VAVVGIGLFQALPLAGQKWENKLLSMRKAEARANPIEQLQNYLLSKRASVNALQDAVAEIGAQIKSLNGMVAERKKAKPGYDSSEEDAEIAKMVVAHKELESVYLSAETALDDLSARIEERKFKHKFSQVGRQAISAINAANGQTPEEMIGEMLVSEADSAILDNYNRVFASLDLHAARLNSTRSLSHSTGLTLDAMDIQMPVGQNVRSQ
jgi:chaperonin cofactor prefoldin